MEIESQSAEDGDEINELVSIQSEASIFQNASEEIKKLIENDLAKKKLPVEENVNDESKDKSKEVISDDSILKARLQNQVRTGEITPFQAAQKESDTKRNLGRTLQESNQLLDLEKYLFQQAELARKKKLLKKNKAKNGKEKDEVPAKKMKMSNSKIVEEKEKDTPKTSNKKHSKKLKTKNSESQKPTTSTNSIGDNNIMYMESSETSNTLIHEQIAAVRDAFGAEEEVDESGSEYVPSDEYDSEEESPEKPQRKKKNNILKQSNTCPKRVLDDGDEDIYKQRVKESGYKKYRTLHKVDHLFKVPQCIWKQLYKYQKVAVKWLWELHTRNLGGLLGDEMGLGKTVQVIAFLAGLDCSELLSDGGRFRGLGPTIIVCPATLLEQWVKHFHDWWPTLRVVILHQSGTFQGELEDLLHSLKAGGLLVISYAGILIHKELLLKFKWHYVILDEGHKIRNPEAKVSKVVKAFLTPHRILLTGSPMQNSLKELWSLFDFILPGKLGTLPAFMEHCAGPITRGGYSNASSLQEATALQVATVLKNAITPYMLRRTKYDVQHHVSLPEKNEQVLFCSLTQEQRELYKQFLRSDDVSYVLHERREGGRYRARLLVALTALRKICNHPDLFLYSDNQAESDEEAELEVSENEIDKFGHWKRAGKMTVVRSLLKIWKKQTHRVLLFTQSRQMTYILESLLVKEKFTYLKMDGATPMNQRQLTVSKFNKDTSFFVFLSTTRVGGLGINLTGADRVIIYDPDWNPATDAQARERAWRIGQDKNVTVYRLITAGTIEEKMYHRQVFKILLSNKVLEDPRQRRLFRTSDLTELFNLNEPINGESSESDQLFRNSKLSPNQPNFSSNKIEAMKKLASTLSKKIGEKAAISQSNKKNCEKEKVFDADKDKSELETKLDDTESMEISNNSKDIDTNESHDSAVENEEKQNTTNQESVKNDEDMLNEKIQEKEVENINSTNTQRDISEVAQADQNDIEEGEILENSTKNAFVQSNDKDLFKDPKKMIKTHNDHKTRRKHKKHKKSKLEDSVSAMFEGERVSYLIGRRLGSSKETVTISDDQYVLSKLFSKAAVSSAFQHESVLASAVINPEDETPLQRAAKETASEKMDCIRQSRKWCWRPCWDNPPEEDYDDSDESD